MNDPYVRDQDNQHHRNQPWGAQHSSVGEEEISLVDIYLFFRHHWKTLLLFCIVGGVIAAAAGTLSDDVYEYTTTIEIGIVASGPTDEIIFDPIESPQEVANKLNQVFVPLNRQQIEKETAIDRTPVIRVDPVNATNLVSLRSEGTLADGELIGALHERVADAVLTDHRTSAGASLERYNTRLQRAKLSLASLSNPDVFAFEKAQLETKLEQAKNQVEALQDSKAERLQQLSVDIKKQQLDIETIGQKRELINSQLEGKAQRKTLLAARIATLQAALAETSDGTVQAFGETQGEESRALTALLINNQMQIRWDQLTSLQTELNATLPSEIEDLRGKLAHLDRDEQKLKGELDTLQLAREQSERDFARRTSIANTEVANAQLALDKFLVDHRHSVADQEQDVHDLENLIASIRHTRLVGLAIPSNDRTNLATAPLAFLGVLAAFFVGLATVIIHELALRANQREQSSPENVSETEGALARHDSPVTAMTRIDDDNTVVARSRRSSL